jgi:hypothetical protein
MTEEIKKPPFFNASTNTYFLRDGGSGRGVSFYKSIGKGCLRRKRMDDELSKTIPAHQPVMNLVGGMGVGTMCHAFMDIITGGYEGPLSAIKFMGMSRDGLSTAQVLIDPKDRALAERVCDWFRFTYGPTFLGEKVGDGEIHFEAVNDPDFGVELFTADLDFVGDLKQIPQGYESIITTPGKWIWDWKFIGSREQMLSYANDPQGMAYRMAGHKMGFVGFGYVFIIKPTRKEEDPVMEIFTLPTIDTDNDAESVREWLRGQEKRWKETPTTHDYDLSDCVTYDYQKRRANVCPYADGRCTRKP